ncbi:hypothetical protein [Thermasporomyces composti]|jgi:hypothetical protein|uniref:Uncharacterized protein n=1 Tax=Thermasporomyces composti TaxID=696763 RepID=A0A3D9V835_THECX|nr:hypothetical protein [Thermasporomyces composti]REF37629.1 hypothetical protein DFJ64_3075 [Thermasporomyces composti]
MNTDRDEAFPALLSDLLDDAAAVPPSDTPLAAAVVGYRRHRQHPLGDALRCVLCPDSGLPGLPAVLGEQLTDQESLPLGLVVTGGAGAIRPALTWLARTERLAVRALHLRLRDEIDLARNVTRVALALDDVDTLDDVPVAVEVPWLDGWQRALDAIAEAGYLATLRLASPEECLPERDVASFLLGCLDREVPFTCAGLDAAIRRAGPGGRERHGILNLLLATRAALDGAGLDDIAQLVAERDTETVVSRLRQLDHAAVRSTRRWVTSCSSPRVSETLRDLVATRFGKD